MGRTDSALSLASVKTLEIYMEIKSSMQKLVDPYSQQVERQQLDRSSQQGQAPQAQATGDRVSVSPQARLYTEAYAAATSAPEIRQDKVAALKEQVANGTYAMDSRKIAEKLLQSEISIHEKLEG